MGHMQHAKSTAAGMAVPAGVEKSFAVTQATWRFFANERVTPQAPVEPLRAFYHYQLKFPECASVYPCCGLQQSCSLLRAV